MLRIRRERKSWVGGEGRYVKIYTDGYESQGERNLRIELLIRPGRGGVSSRNTQTMLLTVDAYFTSLGFPIQSLQIPWTSTGLVKCLPNLSTAPSFD